METHHDIEEGKENLFNRLLAFTLKTEDVLKHSKLSEKLKNHSFSILTFFRNELSGKAHFNPTEELLKILDDGIKQFSRKPFITSDTKEQKLKQRLIYVDLLNEMKQTLLKHNGINILNELYVNTKWTGAGGLDDALKARNEFKKQKK